MKITVIIVLFLLHFVVTFVRADEEDQKPFDDDIIGGDDAFYQFCYLCEGDVQTLWSAIVDYNGTAITCEKLEYDILSGEREGSDGCIAAQQDYADMCCGSKNPCPLCSDDSYDTGIRWWLGVNYNDIPNATCDTIGHYFEESDEECSIIQDSFTEDCCYKYPDYQCELCPFDSNVDWNNPICESAYFESSTIEEESEACTRTQETYTDLCCFVPCNVCPDGEFISYSFRNESLVLDNGTLVTCSEIDESLWNGVGEGSEQCNALSTVDVAETCCWSGACDLCDYGVINGKEIDYNDETITCEDLSWNIVWEFETGSEQCDAFQKDYEDVCCQATNPCYVCPYQGEKWWVDISYNGINTTCSSVSYFVEADDDEKCDALRTELSEECCYEYPDYPTCELCPYPSYTNYSASVIFGGKDTSCDIVSNELGTIENDTDVCVEATEDKLSETCCYIECDICPGEDLNFNFANGWDTSVVYNGTNITCSDVQWITYDTADGSDTCNAIQTDIIIDTCCWKGECSLCGYGGVIYEQEIDYNDETITCEDLSWNIVWEFETGSEQCDAFQKDYEDVCCQATNPCYVCPNQGEKWWVDISYNGINTTCSSVSYFVEADDDEKCDALRTELSEECCYEYPDYPTCELCPYPSTIDYSSSVIFDGKDTSCDIVSNELGTLENDTDVCSKAKEDKLSESCCYVQCDMCPGEDISVDYSKWDTSVVYNGTSITCGDVDWINYYTVDGSDTCNAIQTDIISDTCCWKGECEICGVGTELNYNQTIDYDGENMTCEEFEWRVLWNFGIGSDECDAFIKDYQDACCIVPCEICAGDDVFMDVANWDNSFLYDGKNTTCYEVGEIAYFSGEGSDTCDAFQTNDVLQETCCFKLEPESKLCEENNCLGAGACLLIVDIGAYECEIDPEYFTSSTICEADLGIYCGILDEEDDFVQVCGCEVLNSNFCNYDFGDFGDCESCLRFATEFDCYNDGLPDKGAADCVKWCFSSSTTPSPTSLTPPTETPPPQVAPTTEAPSIQTPSADGTVLLRENEEVYSYDEPIVFDDAGVFMTQKDDGNFVLYRGMPDDEEPFVLLDTGYVGDIGDYYTRLQKDGNLVTRPGKDSSIKPREKAVWKAGGADGRGSYVMELSGDQKYVSMKKIVSSGEHIVIWQQPTYEEEDPEEPVSPTILLMEKESITSSKEYPEANIELVQKKNGNLILYRIEPGEDPIALWKSGFKGEKGPYYTRLQGDGNLVTRPGSEDDDPREDPVFKTRSGGEKGAEYYFALSADQKMLYIVKDDVEVGDVVWYEYL